MRHKYPILRRSRFLTGEMDNDLGVRDLVWIDADGTEMQADDWENSEARCFGMLIDGRSRPTGLIQQGKEITVLIIFNGHYDMVQFKLPKCEGGSGWIRLVDTNLPDEETETPFNSEDTYDVTGRSLLLFALNVEK